MSIKDKDGNALAGDVEFAWPGGGTPSLLFDRIAHSGRNELLFLSLVTDAGRVRQLRAALCDSSKGKDVTITAGGVKTVRASEAGNYWSHRAPGRLRAGSEGYTILTHKLAFGRVHAMFLTKSPGFLMVVTPESLWAELNSPRFTTPILRSWMPYVEQQLRALNRLEDAHCFNCACGVLSATTKSLDDVITAGIIGGELKIEEESAV